MESKKLSTVHKVLAPLLLMLVVLVLSAACVMAQEARQQNALVDVYASSAVAGETVEVTITLPEQGAPPSHVQPRSERISDVIGTDVRSDGAQVSARFGITEGMTPGLKDAEVEFPSHRGSLRARNSASPLRS